MNTEESGSPDTPGERDPLALGEASLNRAREVEQEWEEERAQYTRPRREYDDDDDYERRYDRDRPHRKKRWTEIFDIFD